MVRLNININNRTFILIAVLLVIVLVGGFVFAYNSSPANPAYFGHSVNEIEGVRGDWVEWTTNNQQSLEDFCQSAGYSKGSGACKIRRETQWGQYYNNNTYSGLIWDLKQYYSGSLTREELYCYNDYLVEQAGGQIYPPYSGYYFYIYCLK